MYSQSNPFASVCHFVTKMENKIHQLQLQAVNELTLHFIIIIISFIFIVNARIHFIPNPHSLIDSFTNGQLCCSALDAIHNLFHFYGSYTHTNHVLLIWVNNTWIKIKALTLLLTLWPSLQTYQDAKYTDKNKNGLIFIMQRTIHTITIYTLLSHTHIHYAYNSFPTQTSFIGRMLSPLSLCVLNF